MRYRELTELFDKKAEYQVTMFTNHNFSAEFTANGKLVKFDAYRDEETNSPTWELLFCSMDPDGGGNFGMTHGGDSILIMSTIKAIMQEFFDKFSPMIVRFTASSHEPSRVTLYTKMAVKFIPKIYSMEKGKWHTDTVFAFTRNKK